MESLVGNLHKRFQTWDSLLEGYQAPLTSPFLKVLNAYRKHRKHIVHNANRPSESLSLAFLQPLWCAFKVLMQRSCCTLASCNVKSYLLIHKFFANYWRPSWGAHQSISSRRIANRMPVNCHTFPTALLFWLSSGFCSSFPTPLLSAYSLVIH